MCSTLALIESGGTAAQELEHVHCLLIPNAGPVQLAPLAALMQLALTTAALVSLRAKITWHKSLAYICIPQVGIASFLHNMPVPRDTSMYLSAFDTSCADWTIMERGSCPSVLHESRWTLPCQDLLSATPGAWLQPNG